MRRNQGFSDPVVIFFETFFVFGDSHVGEISSATNLFEGVSIQYKVVKVPRERRRKELQKNKRLLHWFRFFCLTLLLPK